MKRDFAVLQYSKSARQNHPFGENEIRAESFFYFIFSSSIRQPCRIPRGWFFHRGPSRHPWCTEIFFKIFNLL